MARTYSVQTVHWSSLSVTRAFSRSWPQDDFVIWKLHAGNLVLVPKAWHNQEDASANSTADIACNVKHDNKSTSSNSDDFSDGNDRGDIADGYNDKDSCNANSFCSGSNILQWMLVRPSQLRCNAYSWFDSRGE